MKEEVVELNVKDICDFPKHPFKINNDLNYEELKNSIIESGVLVPTIVRKKEDGKYEMLSGHRRKKICEEQGIKKIPCIVKDISDEEAIILMVDSNLQRDKILPSEKAMAYKMKYDAMKSMTPSVSNKRKDEILGEQVGESREQIRRYIRLNNLIPELLQLVDDTVLKDKRSALTMGLRPAVELSYLSKDDQELVYEEITYEDLTPSHVQAKRIRELGEKGELDSDILESIFLEQKPNQAKRLSFNEERIRKVLPKDIKDYKIEDFIIKAIESYSKTLSNERGDSYDLDI
ncbi:MAG: ParB/RepB/Spo0J family partition protein [Bacilli bacterium]|jgi:ParB family transcriptional regulator, chromosome partitioning protein|nr:ParB/RepB/Spo0J family partition protein [Bacilli bacterium]NMA50235.1 ParB/RepB/Spo0J family partition protein [Mollicutes bacterium]